MDKLEIINLALAKCGLPLAAALNDCDWNASCFFDLAKNECLRSFCWGFAQKFSSLSPAGTPAHGFTRSYALPADFMRVVDVRCDHDLRAPKARECRVVGKFIYTQINPCLLRYVSDSVPIEDWPPDFCNLVASRLALEIAPLSTQTMAMVPALANMFNLAQARAEATDARENHERVPHDWNIVAARAGAGEGRGK